MKGDGLEKGIGWFVGKWAGVFGVIRWIGL